MEPILAQSLDEQWHNTINSVAIDDDDDWTVLFDKNEFNEKKALNFLI